MAASITQPISNEKKNMAVSVFCNDRKAGLRACSHERGAVNFPGVIFAPGQTLPRVHMIIYFPWQLCPGASSAPSDHYELILNSLVLTQIVTENERLVYD